MSLEMLQPFSPHLGAGRPAVKFSFVVSVGGRFEPRRDAEAGEEAGWERGAARPRCKALIYPISAKISLPQ